MQHFSWFGLARGEPPGTFREGGARYRARVLCMIRRGGHLRQQILAYQRADLPCLCWHNNNNSVD